MNRLVSYISECIDEPVVTFKPISGGSISSAYRLETRAKAYFLKVNRKPTALTMFQAEKEGLRAIEESNTIAVPHVHLVGSLGNQAFLLMDHVESKRPDGSDYRRLGAQLARLHQIAGERFGFTSDNFIGSLPQSNRNHADWPEFYWQERILPQLEMARRNELLPEKALPTEAKAISLFSRIFGEVKPVLLHGDLWGGNYLIASNGTPYLIDPATYYGHSMVDIAMSYLFGGFGTPFYEAYHEQIPRSDNHDAQIDLYQLYFLLVHLNLFGSGYYASVSSILKRYF
ncbi:MAG: fructosamine kinase family protein [Fermentimonas sp.]|jgi:protein-ribulosamine 3-kinase